MLENLGVNLVVASQQVRSGFLIKRGLCRVELGRRHKSGFRKILIARRSRLAVPELFVFHFGGGELGNPFEAHHDVPQVGDGSVAVLEIEALEKLGGVVRAHPIDGIADGIGRAAVARQRECALLGRHRADREDAARHQPLNSPAMRLASGRVCPAYLLPAFLRYGMDEAQVSCSKVNEQTRMPG